MLTFDQASANHWIFDISAGAGVIDIGSQTHEFGYDLRESIFQPLATGDIVTSYAFPWEGTVGLNTFNPDLDTSISNMFKLDFSNETLLFIPAPYFSGF